MANKSAKRSSHVRDFLQSNQVKQEVIITVISITQVVSEFGWDVEVLCNFLYFIPPLHAERKRKFYLMFPLIL